MRLLMLFAIILITLNSRADVYDELTEVPVVDMAKYAGRPLKDYPPAVFVKRTPKFNIIWNFTDADDEAPTGTEIVDQKKWQALTEAIAQKLPAYLDALDDEASKIFPSWKKNVSGQIYPFDIQIRVGMNGTFNAANKNASVDLAFGDGHLSLQHRRTIHVGAEYSSSAELNGTILTLVHEFGHLVQEVAFEDERVTSETYSDLIFMLGTRGLQPAMGPGLSDLIFNLQCKTKNLSRLDAVTAGTKRGNCNAVSKDGYRDFRKPIPYADVFWFPERHHIATAFDSLIWRWKDAVGLPAVFESFTNLYLTHDPFLGSRDIYQVALKIQTDLIAKFPAQTNAIQTAFADLGWKPLSVYKTKNAPISASIVEPGLIFGVSVNPEIFRVTHAFSPKLVGLDVVTRSHVPLSFYVDFAQLKIARIQLVPEPTCQTKPTADCVCGEEVSSLALRAIFLDRNSVARASELVSLKAAAPAAAQCYRVMIPPYKQDDSVASP